MIPTKMLSSPINVKFFDVEKSCYTTVQWSLNGIRYAEQLVHEILKGQGVKPVYRMLFGLRLIGTDIWLAPNEDLIELYNNKNENESPPDKTHDEKLNSKFDLELRLRFRPTFLARIKELDQTALEVIFSQLRYDFLNTKFIDDKRDFVILNESVQCLIIIDLLRYSIERNIPIDALLSRVKLKDFIPIRASPWQKPFIYVLGDIFNLRQLLQIGIQNCSDVGILKKKFIEQFLQVCKDYASEIYKANCLSLNDKPIKIRLRYCEDEHPFCKLEMKFIVDGKSGDWMDICDIYSVCYGTLNGRLIELNRSNGNPFRLEFQSRYDAKSFISLIDGYYRLMRKWHFNFCPVVTSPQLKFLIQNKIHGPIGLETMRTKLLKSKKTGTYLVRLCMEQDDRYLIDVLLKSRAILTICIDFDPKEKLFSKSVHEVSAVGCEVEVILKEERYTDLKSLIRDTQIQERGISETQIPLQLKYLLIPSEYDDNPALLLSIPKAKLEELESEKNAAFREQFSELPKIIPTKLLKFKNKPLSKSKNKMHVRLAEFTTVTDERSVVIKDHITKVNGRTSNGQSNIQNRGHFNYDFIFNLEYHDCREAKFFDNLELEQIRLADWIFVKHPLFAQTIGVDLRRNSLIQEYFKLGTLSSYLNNLTSEEAINEVTRTVPCQLANALLFLQEKKIIHGKLRCHNIFVSKFNPLSIKVSDPLGKSNFIEDRAFLPPEIYQNGAQIGQQTFIYNISDYDPGIDIWAFGTTLWQVYNQGKLPPPGIYANILIQPKICPDRVWELMEKCWIVDQSSRISPQLIYRDLNDYFAWARPVHTYQYIPESVPGFHLGNNQVTLPNCNTRSGLIKNGSFKSPNVENGESNGGNSQLLKNGRTDVSTKRAFSIQWKSIKFFKAHRTVKHDIEGSYTHLSESTPCSASDVTESNISSIDEQSESSCMQLQEDEVGDSESIKESDEPWVISHEKIRIGCEVGRGSCGLVKKGVLFDWGNLKEQVVALKFINDQNHDEYHMRVEDLKREFSILKNLKHKNVIRSFGIVESNQIMMVVEYLPLGSLLSYLRSVHNYSTNLPLRDYAIGIASGMEYLESRKVIHRDLAARNILLKSTSEVKICDFGLAHLLKGSNEYRVQSNERALPIRWCAPETLRTWVFNHKTDVWSYGIVLWEIFSGGSNPQYSGTLADLHKTLEIERLPKPNRCPDDMYELMLSCWAFNPEERMSFSQVCRYLELQ